MKRLTRWMIALAATALLTAPVPVAAQQTPEPQPAPAQQPTPTEPAPPTPTEPGQPAPTTPPASASQPAQQESAQVDAEAVKRHLTAARDALSQLTQLPAAGQLSGDARTQVSQLITNFNELITTNVEWRASYGKVAANLATLIGDQRSDESPTTPAAGTPGAVGTSGTVALDPSLRAKLVEFRTHLLEFEKAAGGASAPGAKAQSEAPAAATMPSNTTAAGSTSAAPSSVTSSAASAAATAPTQAVGTSGASTSSPAPTGTSGSSAPSQPERETTQAPAPLQTSSTATESNASGALRHLEAIEAILGGRTPDKPTGTSGTTRQEGTAGIDRNQIEQIRAHLAELRRLIAPAGGQ